jgi:hypothetical protein
MQVPESTQFQQSRAIEGRKTLDDGPVAFASQVPFSEPFFLFFSQNIALSVIQRVEPPFVHSIDLKV